MNKFTKIQQFNNVVSLVRKFPETYDKPITFRGTVKLHGTNAGVRIAPDGAITVQSRNREITVEDDNCGFASFVQSRRTTFQAIAETIRDYCDGEADAEEITIFGEWIGLGIQKGVALNKLERRQFVIFAVTVPNWERYAYCGNAPFEGDTYIPLYCLPDDILEHKEGWNDIYCVDTREAYDAEITIDFSDRTNTAMAAEDLTKLTQLVDEQCPWGSLMGVEGVGEGIVWKPVLNDREYGNTDLFFKTKGQSHTKSKVHTMKVTQDPAVVKSVDAFVLKACNADRLDQGLEYIKEMGKPISMQSTGLYLQWVGNDVKTELADDLEASGLTWKHVAKAVNADALNHWKRAVSQTT